MKAIPSNLFQEVIFLHLGKLFVDQGDLKPFDIHLANLKKNPGVHSEFKLPTNQLKKLATTVLKEKLVPTMELKVMSLIEGILVVKDENIVVETISLGAIENIVELLEKDFPILLPFDSMGMGHALGLGSLPIDEVCMVEVTE
ncbi:hypothetical protein KI387_044714, partial [Taxus chinensis]